MIKVRNMLSPGGHLAPNQFIIVDDQGNTYFQSYETIIVKESKEGIIYLDPAWDCSKTTGEYRNQFLGETKRETEAQIKSGEYVITNLN